MRLPGDRCPCREKLPVVRINGNDQGPDPCCPKAFEAYKEIVPLVATPKDDENSLAEGWSGIKAFIKMREAQAEEAASHFADSMRLNLDYYRGFSIVKNWSSQSLQTGKNAS